MYNIGGAGDYFKVGGLATALKGQGWIQGVGGGGGGGD